MPRIACRSSPLQCSAASSTVRPFQPSPFRSYYSLARNPAARGVYAQSLRYFYHKHYSPLAQWLLRGLLPLYQRMAG